MPAGVEEHAPSHRPHKIVDYRDRKARRQLLPPCAPYDLPSAPPFHAQQRVVEQNGSQATGQNPVLGAGPLSALPLRYLRRFPPRARRGSEEPPVVRLSGNQVRWTTFVPGPLVSLRFALH